MHRILRSLAIAALTATAVPLVASLVTPPAWADDSGALYKQGIALKAQGKDDEAILALERSVAANPRNGLAWASLGHLYKKKQDHAKALAAYQEAVKTITNDAVVWSNLGMAFYRANRVDEARAALETSLKLEPKAADVHSNLGVILRKKGDNDGALKELEAAVALAPTDASYLNNYGVALRAANKMPEAIAAFRQAIALGPCCVARPEAVLVADRLAVRWGSRAATPRPALPRARHHGHRRPRGPRSGSYAGAGAPGRAPTADGEVSGTAAA